MSKRRALGSALLGQGRGSDVETVLQEVASKVEDRTADPREIRASPFQPRRSFDAQKLEELAGSIRAQGLLQPLLVRETPTGLELLAGERRQRAAIMAELDRVPIRVLEGISDPDAAAIALTENLAREDLTAWEEAQGLTALRETLDATVRGLAQMTGRAVGTVSEALAIGEGITPSVQKLAGVDVRSLNKLPHTALFRAAKGETEEDRARLLRIAAGAEAPGKAVQEAARPKRGRPPKPYTLRAPTDGRVSFSIRKPEDIGPEDARQILDTLEPVLRTLRERADQQEE